MEQDVSTSLCLLIRIQRIEYSVEGRSGSLRSRRMTRGVAEVSTAIRNRNRDTLSTGKETYVTDNRPGDTYLYISVVVEIFPSRDLPSALVPT